MPGSLSPRTIAVGSGIADDPAFRAIAPPVYLSTTFAFKGFDEPQAFDYVRSGNPTRAQLEKALAALEGGAAAVVVASGMAAIDLVLARLNPGDRVVAPHDCYGGTQKLLNLRSAKGQFEAVFVDQGDQNALARALPGARLVLVETPSNPMMRIIDIRAVASLAKAAGAELAVDNTFLSPALQRPIALGADFVIHSTTKYLNGHSDVLGGAVIAARQEQIEELTTWASTTGTVGAPFDAYLTLRGIRTLFARMERQQQTAATVARFLTEQAQVAMVYYPGLPSHPGHAIAKAQQDGFGAMLSFRLRGGVEAVRAFLAALRLVNLADLLGGVESLIATCHHDACQHVAGGAAGRRHLRRFASPVRRSRRRGGPDRGCSRCARCGLQGD